MSLNTEKPHSYRDIYNKKCAVNVEKSLCDRLYLTY